MVQATYFLQACPTCGRPTRVRVEWLGRHVRCAHCQATFVVRQPGETQAESLLVSAERWLAKAETLLRGIEAADTGQSEACSSGP